jgi:hypothetical protein
MVLKGLQVLLGKEVLLVHKGYKVLRVLREPQELREQQVLKEIKVISVLLAPKAPKGLKASKAHKAMLGLKGLKEFKAFKVRSDLQERKVLWVRKESRDQLDSPVQPDRKVLKVSKVYRELQV